MAKVFQQRGRVERDDDTIYYELAHLGDDAGDGAGDGSGGGDDRPVVVLTHGAGGSHAVWFHQVPVLAQRYRVLTWDSRGFGNSTCRSGEVSVDGAVDDLAAVLDAAGAGAAPVHLVAQSMGGWWCVAFALTHPERVRSLTLSDTPGGLWTPALRERFGGLRGRGNPLYTNVVGFHAALGATTMARHPEQAFLYQQLGSFHEPPMASVLRVLGATSFSIDEVRALGIPLAVIVGEEDAMFSPAELKELADLLGARYAELAEAGHSPYFESPAAYNEALLAILDAAS